MIVSHSSAAVLLECSTSQCWESDLHISKALFVLRSSNHMTTMSTRYTLWKDSSSRVDQFLTCLHSPFLPRKLYTRTSTCTATSSMEKPQCEFIDINSFPMIQEYGACTYTGIGTGTSVMIDHITYFSYSHNTHVSIVQCPVFPMFASCRVCHSVSVKLWALARRDLSNFRSENSDLAVCMLFSLWTNDLLFLCQPQTIQAFLISLVAQWHYTRFIPYPFDSGVQYRTLVIL